MAHEAPGQTLQPTALIHEAWLRLGSEAPPGWQNCANLQTLEPSMNIRKSEDLGWPRQSVEPAAFALLAYRWWRRNAGNLPETTGARRAVLLGQIAEA